MRGTDGYWVPLAQGGYRDEVPEGLDDFPMSHAVVMPKALESDGLGLRCQLCRLCDSGKSHNLSKHGEIIVPPSWGCCKDHKKNSCKMFTIVPGSLKGLRKQCLL